MMVTGTSNNVAGGTENERQNQWCVYSAANHHVYSNKDFFGTYTERKSLVYTGTNESTEVLSFVLGTNTIRSRTVFENQESFVLLTNVIHCPKIKRNLISVGEADARGVKSIFEDGQVKMMFNNRRILSGRRCDKDSRLYILDNTYACPNRALITEEKRTVEQWHKSLGYVNEQTIKKMSELNTVTGLKLKDTQTQELFNTCPSAKMTRTTHPLRETNQITQVGDLLEMDLVGKVKVQALTGENYALIVRDRFSSYSFVTTIRTKDETADNIQKVLTNFEIISGREAKQILNDNGSEFKN